MSGKQLLQAAFLSVLVFVSVQNLDAQTVKKNSTGTGSSKSISGTVTDRDDEPIVGAFVYYKGTTSGVSTDLDGRYTIAAPSSAKNSVLVFQYLGMVSQEFTVGESGQILNVKLLPDNELDGSYIVGAYGTAQKREDMVGSAFQVNSTAIADKPKANVVESLQGLIPGMNIEASADYASTGSARDKYNVRVRGTGSLTGSKSPLWVVDGVPIYTGSKTGSMPGMDYSISPIANIDPADIESITVLKDADQCTMYGSNAAGGVILVTTKHSKDNVPLSVNAVVNFSVSVPDYSTMVKTMNSEQYMEVAKEAWTNSGYSMSDFPYQDNDYNTYSTTSTNWAEQYLGVGNDIYASLSLSSGNKRVKSYVSGSYYRSQNIVKGDNSQRYYIRLNQDYKLLDFVDLGVTLSGTYTDDDLFSSGRHYFDLPPVLSPYLNDGSYRLYNKIWDETTHNWTMKKFYDNYVPDLNENQNNQTGWRTLAQANLKVRICKGLSFDSIFGFEYNHRHESMYYSQLTVRGMDTDGNVRGSSTKADGSVRVIHNTNTLRYNNTFGKHTVGGMAIFELNHNNTRSLSGYGSGFMNDKIRELSYADDTSKGVSSYISTRRTMSYLVRGEYSYDKRYYISGNFRRDGSSALGTYTKWGNFWSAGVSWNVHNEPFFKVNAIKMLKLKASVGTTGNSDDGSSASGTYAYSDTYQYGGTTGAVLSTVPNPGLRWEKKYKANAGFSLSLNKILDIDFEYYYDRTVDMLSSVYVSRVVSDSKISANVGKMQNTGVEVNLQANWIKKGDFTWYTTLNASHNENKILELYEGQHTGFFDSVWMEGYDSRTWWLVEWAGVDPTDGSAMWYDANGNITKTFDYANRKPGKSPNPIVYGGLANTLIYKNFEFSFQINYDIGGWTLPSYYTTMGDGSSIISENQAVEVYYYRWTTPGQAAAFPKVYQDYNYSSIYSTRFLYNKTAFRLRNVALKYNLPRRVVSKMKMSGLSFSLVGDNLYTFTPDQSRKYNSYKTLSSGYPTKMSFTFSINASF